MSDAYQAQQPHRTVVTLPARITRRIHLDPVESGMARPLALRVLHGPGLDSSMVLVDSEVAIGREPGDGVQLVLPDPTVSRLHASLLRSDEAWWVVDRGSSNGVFVNGHRVERAKVGAGDVLRLGDSILSLGAAVEPESDASDLGIVGTSAATVQLRTTIRRVAPSALPVLVQGPTGTGKELVARAIHDLSGRPGAFVAVNCAALPATLIESALFGHRKGSFTGATNDQEGAFQRAHGGTLFLDEIGEMALEEQPKLLRALETLEVAPIGAARPVAVDVRVVVATNVDLPLALERGKFRSDLYARLAGVIIETAPLGGRPEDVLPIFRHCLGETLGARPFTADFAESLCTYAWPLNVRELRRLAERLVVLYPDAPRWERGMIDEPMRVPPPPEPEPEPEPATTAPTSTNGTPTPSTTSASPPAPPAPRPRTREELVALLESCGGNVTLAARRTGRNRKQVYRWMSELGLGTGAGRAR